MPSGTSFDRTISRGGLSALPHWPVPCLHTLEVESWLDSLDTTGPHRFLVMLDPDGTSAYHEYVDLPQHLHTDSTQLDRAIRQVLPQLPLGEVHYQNPPGFPVTGVVTRWRVGDLTIRLHLFPNMLTHQSTRKHDPPRWRKAGVYIQPDHGPGRVHTAKWCALDARGRPWAPS